LGKTRKRFGRDLKTGCKLYFEENGFLSQNILQRFKREFIPKKNRFGKNMQGD
jgi:hypothetical protein